MSVQIGEQIGDYRILAKIGAGAYGEVFEAEHVITRRVDAIKVMSHGSSPTTEEQQRFLREIQVQASLHHPNLAAVYNAFWTSHGLVLVMERVPGETLRAILDRGQVPLQAGVGYVLGTLSGLAYAETRGVVHRDIKPENIIVTADGSVKLTDFGLAQSRTSPRLTQTGEFVGSPSYMSPEQAIGTVPTDVRGDIYSLGVVLYEVATGRTPFLGSGFEVLQAHQSVKPTPPRTLNAAVGPELNVVILRALEKDPAGRFQSAAEFHAALQTSVGLAPGGGVPLSCPGMWSVRRVAMAGVFVAGICTLVATSGRLTLVSHTVPATGAMAKAPTPATPVKTAIVPAKPVVKPAPAVLPPALQPLQQVAQTPPAQPKPEIKPVVAEASKPALEPKAPVPIPQPYAVPAKPQVAAITKPPATPSAAKAAPTPLSRNERMQAQADLFSLKTTAAPAHRTAPAAATPVSHPAQKSKPAPTTATAAALPPPPVLASAPSVVAPTTDVVLLPSAETAAPLPPPDTPAPQPAKRGNAVGRFMGRVFGRHNKNAPDPSTDSKP